MLFVGLARGLGVHPASWILGDGAVRGKMVTSGNAPTSHTAVFYFVRVMTFDNRDGFTNSNLLSFLNLRV